MTRLEDRWADAAMGAIFPGSSESGLADIRAMNVTSFLRQLMRSVPFQAAVGVRMAVWLVALAPLFVLGRFTTIVGLAVADREKLVAKLVASRLYVVRSLVLILKTMGALLYAGNDAVRARMLIPRPDTRRPTGLVTLRAKRVHAA
jgi:hypothetical protein